MPLFVTVTPGTTVSSSTTLDAATLNLLGTPSVDVTGTVDGGSVSITAGSVPLNSLSTQANNTIVGNASGAINSPTALDASTDFTLTGGTFQIKPLAVVEGKIGAKAVTYAKIQDVSNDNRLLGRAGGGVSVAEITVGSNLTLSAGSLNALRPRTAFTNVEAASVYLNAIPNIRANAVEITPLTTQITPQTNTSKVLVQFNFSGEIVYTSAFILERVDGATVTPLGVPSTPENRIYGTKVAPYDGDNNSTQFNISISFLDSPASTNAITYRIKVYSSVNNTTLGLNRSITDTNLTSFSRSTSQVILQEILPT